MKTPLTSLFCAATPIDLISKRQNAAHIGIVPVHDLHFEAAGIADAADGRRRMAMMKASWMPCRLP